MIWFSPNSFCRISARHEVLLRSDERLSSVVDWLVQALLFFPILQRDALKFRIVRRLLRVRLLKIVVPRRDDSSACASSPSSELLIFRWNDVLRSLSSFLEFVSLFRAWRGNSEPGRYLTKVRANVLGTVDIDKPRRQKQAIRSSPFDRPVEIEPPTGKFVFGRNLRFGSGEAVTNRVQGAWWRHEVTF